ncbi:MAG: ArnT family glycosyltransferase [Acidobacteriota bacterium]
MLLWMRIGAFLLILLPSAWFAWQWRDMPAAGYYHDDGLYFVAAQSLAESGEYKISSLPAQPPQTKYPPLWPLVLSLAWHINPIYPQNLPWAMLLAWIWLPATVLLYCRWLRQTGAEEKIIWLLAALWALNPYVILFSTTLLTEMFFTSLLLATLLLLRRPQPGWTAIAGLLAGLAFLVRSAGLVLLPAVVAWLVLRKQPRRATIFASVLAPIMAAWFWWAGTHRTPGSDEITLYYTNYFGYHLSVFSWNELPMYLWRNAEALVSGLGAFLLPSNTTSLLDRVLALTLGVAGISGVLRRLRQDPTGSLAPYAYFSALYILMLIVWHFPPNERFAMPVAPLWFLGIFSEFTHILGTIHKAFQKPDFGQKIAGAVIALLLLSTLGWCASRQFSLVTSDLPVFFSSQSRRFHDSEPTIRYIRENLPADATILAEMDPTLFLRSGRRAAGYILNTVHWYRGDEDARAAAYSDAAQYCKRLGIRYVLLNQWDFSRDLTPEAHDTILRRLPADPRLELVYSSGPSALYRIR